MPRTTPTTEESTSQEQTGRTTRTIEQQIAEAEARLARLRTQSRQLENGQKIILGGMVLAAARHDPRIRSWVIKEADKAVTRDIDKKRLQPLLDELLAMGDQKHPPGNSEREQTDAGNPA